jgi:hypothetical protein
MERPIVRRKAGPARIKDSKDGKELKDKTLPSLLSLPSLVSLDEDRAAARDGGAPTATAVLPASRAVGEIQLQRVTERPVVRRKATPQPQRGPVTAAEPSAVIPRTALVPGERPPALLSAQARSSAGAGRAPLLLAMSRTPQPASFGNSGLIQRSIASASAPASPPATAGQPAGETAVATAPESAPQPEAPPEIDMDEVVEQVMRRLTRSLAVEGERRGRRPWL